jgi:Ni2+-binding GTPase involved in maturation of urease and hydrogenase
MKLHIIGGFLGSGKTTAIEGAARYLAGQGKRVGIVTNDQGQSLVDTAFFRHSGLPTLEVTGSCFCCNFHALEKQVDTLQPNNDVIFAETVGSCADLVATIIKPMRQFRQDYITFTVFTDVRLLRQWLRGELLPLSGDIGYIFGKQIEEAGLLVLNKTDLIAANELQETEKLLQDRFPGKRIHKQNALNEDDITAWVRLLDSGTLQLPETSLTIDYDLYGTGEAELAWLDEEIEFSFTGDGRGILIGFLESIVGAIQQQRIPIGHLKFFVQGESQGFKVSFPTLHEPDWQDHIPAIEGNTMRVLVNARVETAAVSLRQVVEQALQQMRISGSIQVREAELAFFHPGEPRPTYRFA